MDDKMDIGTGVIRFLRAGGPRWNEAFKEWIDNAFDAGASRVEIRLDGNCLEVEDDGRGCPNLIKMESIARSVKSAGSKSSMYGMGGVMSQIRVAKDGRVEVRSVHKDRTSEIVVDWEKCINENKIEPVRHAHSPSPRGVKTMTLIRIPDSKRFYKPQQIVADLGHAYAGEIRRGKKISLVVNGKTFAAEAYAPPPLARRVDFEFDYGGQAIRGFTGIVEEGSPNPHAGWSVHWCYRVAFTTAAPAGRHLVNGVYGEVHLPAGWTNINPTKDEFVDETDGLWERIGEISAELLEEADARSTDIELKDTLDEVADILSRAVIGRGIKGRRPGKAGEEGTKSPTGRGGKHREFTTWQEGDIPGEEAELLPIRRAPSLIRVSFVDGQEHAFKVELSGTKDRTLQITLDRARPQIDLFRKDPVKLATLCAPYIAHALTGSIPQFKDAFPCFRDHEFHDLHDELLARISLAEAVKEAV